ncbi:MAG: NADH-quinone oxidoreductase subunit C [bacterium]
MDEKTQQKATAKFGERIHEVSTDFDELTLVVAPDHALELIKFLRDDPQLQYLHLSDISCADWPERERRFGLVYHLYSFELKSYVRIKVWLAEGEQMATLTGEWDTANWLEREVYDMFGISFSGHPDLRRILMWPEFEGHPLRRDFPLTYEMPRFSHNKDNPPEVIK